MISFIAWFFSQPLYVCISIYALIGILVGINLRVFMARHLWTVHQRERRHHNGDCWCSYDFPDYPPSRGDWVTLAIWTAPFIWPIAFAVSLMVIPIMLYAKILGFVHSLVQKGARKMLEEHRSLNDLRKAYSDLESKYKASVSAQEDQVRWTETQMKRADAAEAELKNLKAAETAKSDADARVDRVLERSQKLLDEIIGREPE
jgi:hypothetical protein